VFHLKPGPAQLGLQGIGQHGVVFSKQEFHARKLNGSAPHSPQSEWILHEGLT
jgi:hypothetical protein